MSMKDSMNIVILGAGEGSRMCSNLPKVFHILAGKSMIQYVIDTAKQITSSQIYLVCSFATKNKFIQLIKDHNINLIVQKKQLGTGNAIQLAVSNLSENEDVLILYGDVPLISQETIKRLYKAKPLGGISLLTAILKNPDGYGRIIRKNNKIIGIIEHKDANQTELKIKEVNTGILIVNIKDLKYWLSQINNYNSQGEYYITDIISLAHKDNKSIISINPNDNYEIQGVNNRLQLAYLERLYQKKQSEKLLLSGVTLRDPTRFDLRGTFKYGNDVNIDINVIIEGKVIVGNRVNIGSGCVIKNSIIGDDCNISSYSIIDNSVIGNFCTIGPFAHLRTGSKLDEHVHVGNFVEIKKSQLGLGSKAGHLSYIGDAEIGHDVNIGAGTITCNYDGANKSKTLIGDNVFIGSDTQLIAPISVACGATIAAGTTVMKNITSNNLIFNRKEQNYKINWKRPIKRKK